MYLYSLKRHNYTYYSKIKFPQRTDHFLRSRVRYWSSDQWSPSSTGFGRQDVNTCLNQTNRGEVTRRNLRQPTSTSTWSKNQLARRALCFALLWFALLCTNGRSAPEGSVFCTRQDAPWQKSKVSRSHDRQTGVGICVQFVHAGEASARASVIRPRQRRHRKK